MKRLIVSLAGLLCTAAVSAQTWEANNGKFTLMGCYGKEEGVYCDVSYTLTKRQTFTLAIGAARDSFVQEGYFQIVTPDGETLKPQAYGFGDIRGDTREDVVAGKPSKFEVLFNIPNTTTFLKELNVLDHVIKNVPVRPYNLAVTDTVALKLPFATSFGLGNYGGSLSNCQQQGAAYVCTITLTHK